MSELLPLADDKEVALARAQGALRAGELVVLPTDTVYGLGADPFNPDATRRVFEVKRRPRSLPLPILVSRPKQAWALCADVPSGAVDLAAAFWPGALTLVLPQAAELFWDLGESNGTVAIRMPAHDDVLALLELVGPMAVTSANITGEPTPPTAAEVRERLGDSVALYLDGGRARSEVGSTIVDLTRPTPLLARQGPIPASEIVRILGMPVDGA